MSEEEEEWEREREESRVLCSSLIGDFSQVFE